MLTKSEPIRDLKQIITHGRVDLWLDYLVEMCNQQKTHHVLFSDAQVAEHQRALDFFAAPKFVALANAIFFYKLHPEALFPQQIPPEKLMSVRMRLGILYYHIEWIQRQLYNAALKQDLNPGIDYLLHGNELPQGVTLEVDQAYQRMLQEAIKKLKIASMPQHQKREALEWLHDLRKAYKFWFNPNLLIDAVMVLQQHFMALLQHEMVTLFGLLPTTECLDLYGYFSNKDTRYLLHTLSTLTQGACCDWLPVLNQEELATIQKVLHSLTSVLEALRIELKSRQVHTEPFIYFIDKEQVHIGRRNREAVLRVIAIYGKKPDIKGDSLEHWFQLLEETS